MTQATEAKAQYVAPALADLGDINEITKNINVIGPGDSIFSLLAQAS